ncbi:ABC transporter substrate-binding protein [Mycobacterium sp. GA-1285]|uniref:ABC transporter substrate-binding protein n=1 Tax=Mycobacterium sp. GA-1285 TaxID=1772282 RepID=UPI00074B17CB|nr:ABC transporter substrate-binding protein [Mycobacterium sp. GA-1285]KUI12065.1 ABC transporter substrate-binding protein [Mycobacterium sp. GA-1285]
METLRVGMAMPDPPFNAMPDGGGLDVDLMHALSEKIGATVDFKPYEGHDFEGIFDALGSDYDCVPAGTVTPEREEKATFLPPYLISGQALAVDTRRLPRVTSIDGLDGLTVGVKRGDTSRPIAERLVHDGKAGAVRSYDYGSIHDALTDLASGDCDALMTLAPTLTELVRQVPGIEVVQRGITVEDIAIAVPLGDQALLSRLTVAQAELEADGTLQRIRRKWLGNPYADQNLAVR